MVVITFLCWSSIFYLFLFVHNKLFSVTTSWAQHSSNTLYIFFICTIRFTNYTSSTLTHIILHLFRYIIYFFYICLSVYLFMYFLSLFVLYNFLSRYVVFSTCHVIGILYSLLNLVIYNHIIYSRYFICQLILLVFFIFFSFYNIFSSYSYFIF